MTYTYTHTYIHTLPTLCKLVGAKTTLKCSYKKETTLSALIRKREEIKCHNALINNKTKNKEVTNTRELELGQKLEQELGKELGQGLRKELGQG